MDGLTKMVYYESVKTITDITGLAKVILDMIVRYHSLLKSIISNRGSLFI